MAGIAGTSGPFTGYKQVDEFGPEEEYEDGEEEFYITLDLGSVDQTLLPSSSTYRIIGLDSPSPFLQLAGTVLKGEYQTLLGTELLFLEAQEGQVSQNGKRDFKYFASTEHRIRFREVELRRKEAKDGVSPNKLEENDEDVIPEDRDLSMNDDEVLGDDEALGTGTETATRPDTTGKINDDLIMDVDD